MKATLIKAMVILTLVLAASTAVALTVGSQKIDFGTLWSDPFSRTLFFRLRLPRVLMGLTIGASLAVTGAALQALFRNPLADPYTLGISGGGALGASLAIALGWGARVAGVPLVFLASFAGAIVAATLVRAIARTGAVVLPGALLLSGVVVNLVSLAAVMTIEYVAAPNSSLEILRWIAGSLDVIGIAPVGYMLILLVPSWLVLLAFSRQLNLLAIDEDTATTLGVNVHRTETVVHTICSLIVGVTVAMGGTIGFVGLIVPHAVRLMFGEDLRVVLPGSLLLGAAFLVLADALGRSVMPSGELPVGAITGLLGGPAFLWLLRRRRQYAAM
ncbi:MAG TPA: iron ABC transporter permease [Bryobacteraceae bacterium]|jgi:iron complex transport system permease protein|nr:iron ABC transporter permease [Bryobacteraceae bacterium]